MPATYLPQPALSKARIEGFVFGPSPQGFGSEARRKWAKEAYLLVRRMSPRGSVTKLPRVFGRVF